MGSIALLGIQKIIKSSGKSLFLAGKKVKFSFSKFILLNTDYNNYINLSFQFANMCSVFPVYCLVLIL